MRESLTPFQVFAKNTRGTRMVEPNLSGQVEDSPEARNTRDVLAVRLAEREREQIAAAAGLQGMPISTYLRCAALQASAVAIGRASVATARPREWPAPAPPRKLRVIEVVPEPRAHYVDGELVRSSE
jgi:hypothetical protein